MDHFFNCHRRVVVLLKEMLNISFSVPLGTLDVSSMGGIKETLTRCLNNKWIRGNIPHSGDVLFEGLLIKTLKLDSGGVSISQNF